MTTEIINTVFEETEKEINPFIQYCENLVIENNDDYIRAIEQIKIAKSRVKEIEETRKKITRPQDEAKKAVMAQSKPLTEALANIEKILKQKILEYCKKQEELRLEKEKKTKMPVIPLIPVVAGISFRCKWIVKIKDEAKIPKQYTKKVTDMTLLEKIAAETNGSFKIPGVIFEKTNSIAIKT